MLNRLLSLTAIAAFSFVAYVQADDQAQIQIKVQAPNANPTTENLLFSEDDGDEAPETTLACKDCHHAEEEEATVGEEPVKQIKLASDATESTKKVVTPTDARTVEEQQLEEQVKKETALAKCKGCGKGKKSFAPSFHHGKGEDHHFFA